MKIDLLVKPSDDLATTRDEKAVARKIEGSRGKWEKIKINN